MNDDAMVKVMQALSLDYNPAIQATQAFEFRIASLNKQLLEMKAMALQSVKDINSTFSSTLGTLGGNKTILDQWGQPLKTIQAEAEKTATTIKDITGKTVKPPKIEPTKIPKPDDKEFNIWADQWNRRIQWFISGAAFYGGIKAAKAAVESMSEVEMGITEIARVMEDSSFVFNDYRDQLLQLGVDYGQSFENVQDIALRWAQAGYNVKDSLENTKASLLALNTAELDASTATESLIGIMAQWKLTSADLPLVLDKINKTADDFTITSQDLVDGLLRSSGAAKIMGLSLDQTISLLTVMREASGRTGREVGNALNSILSYVQRPAAIKAFEANGIKVFADEARTQFRNVMDIFQDVAAKWPSLSEQVRDGFVKAADDAGLFNDELAQAIGTQQEWNDLQQRDLAQASAGVYRRNYFIGMIERLSQAQEVLNNMTDAAGYSQAENARTMDTLAKKYESLKTAAKQLAIALGDAGLLDTLKDIVDGATNAATAISKLNPEMKALLTTALEIIAISAGLKGVMKLFTDKNLLIGAGALLPGWTKLLAIIPAVASAIALYSYNSKKAGEGGIQNSARMIEAAKKEVEETNNLINEYEALKKKSDETEEAKTRLHEIEVKLAELYPDTVNGIDAQNKSYTTQIGLVKQLSSEKQKAYEDDLRRTAAEGKMKMQSLIAERDQLESQKSSLQSSASASQTFVEKYSGLYEKAAREAAAGGVSEATQREIQSIQDERYSFAHTAGFMATMEQEMDKWNQYGSQIADVTKKLDENKKTREQYAQAIVGLQEMEKPWLYNPGPYPGQEEAQSTGAPEAQSTGAPSTDPGVGGSMGYVSKFSAEINRYLVLESVLTDINNEISRNNTLQEQAESSQKIALIEKETVLLKQQQAALHSINEERRKEASELRGYLSSAGISFNAAGNPENYQSVLRSLSAYINSLGDSTDAEKQARQAAADRYNEIQTALDKYMQLVHTDIPQASNEWWELEGSIKDNQKAIDGLNYTNAENEIKRWADLGVYSIQEQIDAYRKLYKAKADSEDEEYDRIKNLFDLYKDLLDEQQSKVKDAYDERMDAIDKEAEKKKAAQQEIIDGIEEELELLDREDTEHDYETKMADLEKERAYWSVRTGEDARQKLADTIKEIDEAEHDRETELQKQKLDDKKKNAEGEIDAIETAADKEKEKWEASYKLIEKAFDDHSDNIVARAAAMSQEAYQKWVDNYLTPLRNALKTGDVEEFESGSGKLGKSISDLSSHDWGMTDADYKTFIANGEKWFATDDTAARASLQAENDRLRKKYGQDPTLGEYPKFHTGGTVLESGRLIAKKGELILPPDLSKSVNRLFSALKSGSHTVKSTSNTTYDNKRDIKIDKLVNIEKFQPSDDVDSEIMARQIGRELTRI